MSTIVDELIVRLQLDPSDFDKGRKQAAQAWLKTRDAAVQNSKDIENSAKNTAAAIDRTTKAALGLFGVLVGAHGLADFASGVMTTDAALGRMSSNIGMSARDFQAWQLAAERVGGSAEATAGSIATANKQMMDMRVNANNVPAGLQRLFAETGIHPNFRGSVQDYMLDIARATQLDAQVTSRQHAAYLLSSSGYDDGVANLMMSGGGTQQNLNSMPVTSQQTIDRMQRLQTQWTNLQQTFGKWAQNTFGDLEPKLEQVIGGFQQLGDLLNQLEAKHPGINLFATLTAGAVASLFAVSKLIGGINALKLLLAGGEAAAGGEATAAAGGGGLLGWLLGVATSPIGLAAAFWAATTTPAGASEDALVKQMGLTRSTGSTEDYIRRSAIAHGINPETALTVARREGLGNYAGDDNSSFGPYQLHYGSTSGQYPHSGLGDAFTKATGLDARDPATVKRQIDFAMQWASQHGWGDWSGAKAAGITGKMGIGATSWAPWANLVNKRGGGSVFIGDVHVVIQGGADANRIAASIKPALKRATLAQQAQYGPA